MRFRRCLAAAALGLLPLSGCQGGGNGSPTAPNPGNPSNPCGTALAADQSAPAPPDETRRHDKRTALDRGGRYRVFDALSLHREAAQWRATRERELGAAAGAPGRGAGGPDSVDIGEIAVIQDEGDLIAPPNSYDLRGLGLRFTPNSAGGYDVRRITAAFRTTLGRQLTLSDDDSTPANVPFGFNFYGRTQTTAFVNSDGNVTFEEE